MRSRPTKQSSHCFFPLDPVALPRVLSVTCTLALTVATAPAIASHLPGPFLCPVLAVLACVSSVGASLDQAWQIVKGAFYAALFGFVLAGASPAAAA